MAQAIEHHGGRVITCHYLAEWGKGHPHFFEQVAEALDILAPVVRPLVLQLVLAAMDKEMWLQDGPPLDCRTLQLTKLPADLRLFTTYEVGTTETANALDGATVRRWMEQAVNQPAPAGKETGWGDLIADATAARLDKAYDELLLPCLDGGYELPLQPDEGYETLSVPVRDNEVVGPRQGTRPTPPIRMSFGRQGWSLMLRLELAWSVFSSGPGRMRVDSVLSALKERGWST